MARGPGWTKEHTTYVLLFRLLTGLTFQQIADKMRSLWDWCTVNREDLRVIMRSRESMKKQIPEHLFHDALVVKEWPLAKHIEAGEDLEGEEHEIVHGFLTNVVNQEDLNQNGLIYLHIMEIPRNPGIPDFSSPHDPVTGGERAREPNEAEDAVGGRRVRSGRVGRSTRPRPSQAAQRQARQAQLHEAARAEIQAELENQYQTQVKQIRSGYEAELNRLRVQVEQQLEMQPQHQGWRQMINETIITTPQPGLAFESVVTALAHELMQLASREVDPVTFWNARVHTTPANPDPVVVLQPMTWRHPDHYNIENAENHGFAVTFAMVNRLYNGDVNFDQFMAELHGLLLTWVPQRQYLAMGEQQTYLLQAVTQMRPGTIVNPANAQRGPDRFEFMLDPGTQIDVENGRTGLDCD